MAHERVEVLIIGSGPTGLGAATRLEQKGFTDWLLIDQGEKAGGLAITDETPEGFLFDIGGHVIFSHYAYFDELLNDALGEEAWNTHERVSYVWMKNRWVAYPFQNNISALDVEDQEECLAGLVDAKVENAVARSKPKDFDEWILRTQGEGLANIFMRPYNFKVWAVPTTFMQSDWLGERVATADTRRAISNVLRNKEDGGWGPNAVFKFPKQGGTGAIWEGVANLLPQKRLSFGKGNLVVDVDPESKTVRTSSGRMIEYGKLLSTLPLDNMLEMVGRPDLNEGLFHSSSHIIGIGLRGKVPHGKKCWLYFPESDCPFYRTTIFSNYAEGNCPPADRELPTLCLGDGGSPNDTSARPGPWWSLMFEVSESSFKPVSQLATKIGGTAGVWPAIVLETLKGAVKTKLIREDDEIVSISHRRVEHGYPTPSLKRDEALNEALPWLKERSIWSRGRFGSYKYEVANQDHSCMLGVEAADNMMHGNMELTLNYHNIVNRRRDTDLVYDRVRRK